GSVEQFSPDAVERLLNTPGIAESREGEFGDVRVSRLLHEAEIEADHLLLDLGDSAGSWSRRCLGMADRLLVAVPAGADNEVLDRTLALLGGCPQGLTRTVVILHPDGSAKPSESALLAERLAADDVL